jgi:Putative prokaryotic signal transducing protein
MVILWVVLAIVVVAVAARAMRAADAARKARAAKPGEGLHRPVAPVEDDDLVILGEYDHEEAAVLYGLLDSNGIPALLRGAQGTIAPAYRGVPRRERVLVAADRADEARALLAAPPS